jgi:magnesium-transporting ATPase (P-type)
VFGGAGGLAAALGTNVKAGLDEPAVTASRARHGANEYRQVPHKNFFAIFYEGFKDPVILLLCAAATVRRVVCVSGRSWLLFSCKPAWCQER